MSSSLNQIELAERQSVAPDSDRAHSDVEIESWSIEHSLPPTDGGKQAWMVLASCCLVQAPAWGYPLGFGVIQQYLKEDSQQQFSGSPDSIATIGTTLSVYRY
jgi:hypothetical protein